MARRAMGWCSAPETRLANTFRTVPRDETGTDGEPSAAEQPGF
jgi:hypothetical protein